MQKIKAYMRFEVLVVVEGDTMQDGRSDVLEETVCSVLRVVKMRVIGSHGRAA